MALSLTTLKNGIKDILHNVPKSAGEAAQRWASAYATYAADAQSCGGGSPISLAAAQATMQTTLQAAFANTAASASGGFTAIAAAYEAFWVTVTFSGVPPGAFTSCGSLASSLAAAGASLRNDPGANPDKAAQSLASAIDTFTKTVVVTHGAPISCSAPIT